MPLLNWLLGKRDVNKGSAGAGKSRLVWFELQVCPFEFRLAVIPGQPVLIGFAGGGQEQGETTLMPYERNRGAVDALVNALDAAIGKSDIFFTPPHAAEQGLCRGCHADGFAARSGGLFRQSPLGGRLPA